MKILYHVIWFTVTLSLLSNLLEAVPIKNDSDNQSKLTAHDRVDSQLSSEPSTSTYSDLSLTVSKEKIIIPSSTQNRISKIKNTPNNSEPDDKKISDKGILSDHGDQVDESVSRKVISRSKRSAMLLNKIVSALHKVMDNNKSRASNRIYLDSSFQAAALSQDMDFHRQTGSKKMIRKCYFNPVACF